jgi:imidazolonepropionase-like amidohydrolase
VSNGTDNAYKLAKKYNVKIAFGTDCLFDGKLSGRQGAKLAKLSRWFTPYEVLRMATSQNAELLAMCGPRNPYKQGKLGVIEEGAYADMILVDGNPLQNLNLIADPGKNFVLIMKDGVIYKNALD